ncbi:SDR family oxidoreductase [Peribacillus deserti]|uniref:NAD(P)-dependent oxidoreductase n=1 Tax=Peribacillus deserti TaxID=673318 RepID=A0A2N5M4B6_9BACI|nr:SDR family oxidoreductase [Peribacillus deserti]PLT29113.1 NAD(P)-dependent oxidoreductase [Peribacillus deserti]
MKVLVVGANGQVGQHLVRLLSENNDHTVRALVRKEEQLSYFKEIGAEAVLADLEGSVDQLAEAARGCDAVVFTAGSGGSTGADKTLLIDLDGAVKTVEAAEKAGITRFIMVSALQAHNRENWNEKIKPYYAAKHYADKALVQSSLNYTIIRPGGLLNEPGSGQIEAAENLDRGTISRDDVASCIMAALDEEHTFKKAFDVISGDVPIKEALKRI